MQVKLLRYSALAGCIAAQMGCAGAGSKALQEEDAVCFLLVALATEGRPIDTMSNVKSFYLGRLDARDPNWGEKAGTAMVRVVELREGPDADPDAVGAMLQSCAQVADASVGRNMAKAVSVNNASS